MGQLQLNIRELYRLTLPQFLNAAEGLYELIKLQHRTSWEISRWQTTILVNMQTKKVIKPTDLRVFEWDNKSEGKPDVMTKEEALALVEKWK